MSNKIDKLTLKAIRRAARLGTLGLDLRGKVARTGRPSIRKQRKDWRNGKGILD